MRAMCVGDLHLGSGSEYGREPGERLREQADVWARIVDLAVENNCDALLFAGDAFEGPLPTPEQYVAFGAPLAAHPDLLVLAIRGNGRHDSAMRDRNALEVFQAGYAHGSSVVHSTPGIHRFGDVAVATLPWAPPGRLVAAQGGGDRDELHREVAALLVETARGLRAQIPAGTPAVLMLHWSVSGAVTPDGADVGLFREPVLDLHELEALGFDVIVCGHIHKPQQLSKSTHVFYVGSPMPLNFGEASCDHGVYILELAPLLNEVEFVPIESRRFLTLDVDVLGEAPEDALDGILFEIDTRAPEIRDAVVKLRYRATAEAARRIDNAALRKALEDAGARKVYQIEAQVERETRARVQGLDEELDEMQALELWIAAQGVNGSRAQALRDLTSHYLNEVTR